MSKPYKMQRPVMDPTFVEEMQAPKVQRRWVRFLAGSFRWLARKMLSHPLRWRKARPADYQENWSARVMRGFAYRLLFAPVMIALIACAFVFLGTHPKRAAAERDPGAFDLHYEQVSFASEDGVQLSAWLVPVVDARRVNLHRDRLLRQVYPAVVLVHDHGQSQEQVLPLIRPLHEEGMVVLAIGVRGTGLSSGAGQTFGLNESGDVIAAVKMLRQHPFIDTKKIMVVGLGTGANAAVLAAEKDAEIRAMVLLDPLDDASDVVTRRIGPNNSLLHWMKPATRWAFEVAYKHDIEEIALSQHQKLLSSRPFLRLDQTTQDSRLHGEIVEKVRTYCRQAMR